METLFQKRNRIWTIVVFWLFIALLLTTKSSIGQLHKFGFSTWFQNFFFQASGAAVWAIFTPLLIRFYKRFDPTSGKIANALLAHLLLSIPLAIAHRSLALLLDFGVRSLTGMEFFSNKNPLDVLWRFRLVIFESSIMGLITYWLIVVALVAISYYRKHKQEQFNVQVVEPKPEHEPVTQLKIKEDNAYKLIETATILSCEASGNYIMLHTTSGQYRLRQTMSQLEKQLDQSFIRVHRSSIVNLNFLDSFEHLYQGEYLLKLKNGRQLTSTRAYRDNLLPILTAT